MDPTPLFSPSRLATSTFNVFSIDSSLTNSHILPSVSLASTEESVDDDTDEQDVEKNGGTGAHDHPEHDTPS